MILSQDSPDVPGPAEPAAQFGRSVAADDLNGDGYADLAIGSPQHGLYDEVFYHGAVTVLFGGQDGLGRATSISGARRLGSAVGTGDVNGDGRADLVTGHVSQLIPLGGEARVRYGTRRGLPAEPDLSIAQSSLGLPDPAGPNDQFGSAVAIGDVNADGYADVAIGMQGKPAGEATRAGSVVLLTGGSSGLSTASAQSFGQDTWRTRHRRTERPFRMVAFALDYNRDSRADLTVAAVGENKRDTSQYRGDGAVSVLPGTASGPTGSAAATFGPAELGADPANAGFGWSLIP